MQLPGIPLVSDWTDVERAFTPGASFETSTGPATIAVHSLGELGVPSGRIVACDPLCFPESAPFTRRVATGRYPVEVSVARMPNGDERIACARLVLRPERPVRWELATRDGQDRSTLGEGEVFGYPVDAGLGCFMDALLGEVLVAACERLGPDGNYYDVLAEELDANEHTTWCFADHQPHGSRKGNILIFSSGWGDGYYASAWGLDAAGEAVCLVTDFSAL